MTEHRVGLVYPLDDEPTAKLLSDSVTVVVPENDGPEAMTRLLAEVDAVIMRSPAKIDREQIAESPGLRIIAGLGAGTDTVDLDAAADHRVRIVNASGVSPETIGEYVIAAMSLARRGLFRANYALRTGENFEWKKRTAYRGRQVTGCTLGVVGFGHIGKAAARMAQAAFNVRVLAYDPVVTIDDPSVRQVHDLNELMRESDVVSMHTPLLPSTRKLIGAEHLRLLGRDGVFINISRGGVVDQDALLDALENGTLGNAVLDVYDPEPPSDETLARLTALPGVFLTPHLGGQTFEAHAARERSVVEQVLAALGSESTGTGGR